MSVISDIISAIEIKSAFQEMVTMAGNQVKDLLPIGLGFMGVMSLPKICKRLYHMFF